MMDVAYWKKAWQDARENSSLAAGYRRPDHWERFWDQFADRYARDNRRNRTLFERIIETLMADQALPPSGSVLDIGCGPGTYALPLAAKSATVTGLDTAPTMLAILEREAARDGLSDRIKTVVGDWNDFPDDQVFDLVMAANSPAIRDFDSLSKMNRLSRRSGCLISFAGHYHSSLRKMLWQRVMGAPLQSRAFDLIYPFNLLYLSGFFPQVRFFPFDWTALHDVEEMVRHYTDYFAVFGHQDRAVTDIIRTCLQANAQNGKIQDRHTGQIGVVWWRIDQPQPDHPG
jgi:SAM-dependent methyltransferase